MKFVEFESARRCCPAALAVTAQKTRVVFRADKALAAECKLQKGDLYSVAHDAETGRLALLPDPTNKSGNASKWIPVGSGTRCSFRIDFPRKDLFARLWPKEAGIAALLLDEKRKPGVILFHSPEGKESE